MAWDDSDAEDDEWGKKEKEPKPMCLEWSDDDEEEDALPDRRARRRELHPSPMGGVSASSMDSELVRLISNEMQCPICADLMLEPHMVCSNQHNLCQDCLGSLLENRDNRCPECREIITSISRNRFACKAVEVLASMKLGTALVEERMERKSGFENRQLDLDRLLAAISASPSAGDVFSEHMSESGLAPGPLSTWARRAFSPLRWEVQDQTSSSSRGSFNTTLCRFYSTPNGCLRGEMCTFAHGVAELRETETERSSPISPREYGSSLRAILLNDTLAPTGDQEALDRILDVQRRRDSEMELRLGQREESRDSPSRWARDNWGQRAREVGSRVQDQTRTMEYGSSLRAILLNDTLAPTGDQEALDRILDVQRRRDSEMELRHGQREEARDSPSRWARDNWGQRARVQDQTSSSSRGPFKTTLCRFYSTPNGCLRGEMCTFAHGVAELRETETERVY
jgi:hypothetical protein